MIDPHTNGFMRGTSPTLIFTFPFDVDLITALYATFNQNGRLVVEKTLADCETDDEHPDALSLHLGQTDTLLFSADYPADLQIRGVVRGEQVASKHIMLTVGRINKDGMIT